jgi:putative nucleotidyltransferase with HDIG domain
LKDKNLVATTEDYVRRTVAVKEGTLTIAHDFKHVDRVRKWALIIAGKEGFSDLELIEVATLLHDIGLGYIDEKIDRRKHGEVGAELAAAFLKDHSNYSHEQIDQIADAINYHSLPPRVVAAHLSFIGGDGRLLEILRDADNIDAMGAIGLMRAFTSKYYLPDYDPDNIKGETWGLTTHEFLSGVNKSPGSVKFIIDQVNQQIRYYDSLHTNAAKQIGLPLVQFTQNFILELESEINHPRN